ncbi:peptide MFS transporter [Peptacetobacter sp.]|uniref:peptide MFS transporter n=1 Tax=Peptacetobacter sp. TaxID=2991975 RepID=UPI002616FECF|nr:MFS transporter [Peptacetobacter sp.]
MGETKKKGYPKGFWVCGTTEIFERLAYYLGRSLILIFVTASVATGGLGLSNAQGATMQSLLTAFAYLGPLLGGVIADRYIGGRYTTPVGMVIVGIGYWCGSIAKSPAMVYVMILCVSVGLGLYKTGALIGRIITDKDQIDSAFSIRYTLVNAGAFVGTFLVGILYKDVFAKNGILGFAPCFKLAAIAMWLGAIWFMLGARYMGEIGKKPFKLEKTAEELEREKEEKANKKEASNEPLTKVEKKRIAAIFLVAGFSVIFWIFWNLAYLPVYYYWTQHMNWVVAGYEVPTTWFDAANSMFCVILGPLTAMLWRKLAARPQGDMSLFKKTGVGIGILGVSYIFFAVLDIARGGAKISVLWLLIFAFLLTLGEMFFSPLGHAFISKYSPSRFLSTMMAVWGIATFISSLLYGPIFAKTFEGGFKFSHVCIGIAVIAFISAVVLFALDKKLSKLVEEDEEA